MTDKKSAGKKFLESHSPLNFDTLLDDYANFLIHEAQIDKLPVNLEMIFAKFGITSKSARINNRGAMINENIILYNEVDRESVQLFTQAHELVEILFEALKKYDPVSISEADLLNFLDEKETHCDTGASRILLPQEFFIQELTRKGFSLKSACEIASLAKASLTTTIRRMLELSVEKAVFVVWKCGYRNEEEEIIKLSKIQLSFIEPDLPVPKLRVEKIFNPQNLPLQILINKSIGKDSSVVRALNLSTGEISIGNDYLEIFKNDEGEYKTESIRANYGDERRVLSLIYLDS